MVSANGVSSTSSTAEVADWDLADATEGDVNAYWEPTIPNVPNPPLYQPEPLPPPKLTTTWKDIELWNRGFEELEAKRKAKEAEEKRPPPSWVQAGIDATKVASLQQRMAQNHETLIYGGSWFGPPGTIGATFGCIIDSIFTQNADQDQWIEDTLNGLEALGEQAFSRSFRKLDKPKK